MRVQYKLLFNKLFYAMSILVAWLGNTDLRAAAADPGGRRAAAADAAAVSVSAVRRMRRGASARDATTAAA